jgi:hypothetical protein
MAQCMQQGGAVWSQVNRASFRRRRSFRPSVTNEGPMWGFHLDDMNLALGNLSLDVVYEEASYP